MSSLCFYFQVHQPYRIRRLSYFSDLMRGDYFDSALNKQVMKKVAEKCYLPTNKLMLELIKRHPGAFRISYSISGVAIDQMREGSPETLESFQKLAATGSVEFLSETYYHSLSSLQPSLEFENQIALHQKLMRETFDAQTQVFRNTELIYSDLIGSRVHSLGFKAIIAEGADDILQYRSPNYIYQHPDTDLKLLLKNYRLSDDIAFRFSNRSWSEWPLTTEKFAGWLGQLGPDVDTLNLFMDYETFGEHQWAEHGIFQFLEHLPEAILKLKNWDFKTPSEVIEKTAPIARLSFPRLVSWADELRDTTAWLGNEMQTKAFAQIYALEKEIVSRNNPEALSLWRKLQTSDHFYYMCTKWFADGDVHAYFSPYESPYEAFIFFQNVLKNLDADFHHFRKKNFIPSPALAPQASPLNTSARQI